MQEGWGRGLFVKGDSPHTHKQSRKKKIMKTTSKKNNSELVNQTAQSSNTKAPAIQAEPATPTPAQPTKTDTRLPLDYTARTTNRAKEPGQVLDMLAAADPTLYDRAEVVGHWVWVSFNEKPAPEVRNTLAQIGFHWNSSRQTWQHPCGQFVAKGSAGDPRNHYANYFPSDAKTV